MEQSGDGDTSFPRTQYPHGRGGVIKPLTKSVLDSRCRRPNAKNHSDAIDDDSQRLKTERRIGHWVFGVLGAALAEVKGRP